ncbi:transcriptional coactivator/pterin dehydratase [Aspergillus campestris IBT 28561]|uniref:4a-hydroxytetrahydrobiopterin dehydratase n=1 Tax=Aspergillus campestris (strain IBT 28561) TaxID=1392248 RepID=A0A2I1CVN4_ASPC2|nr:transcriptional coactivator/pterin dehydratase [Aspergillus campestris IBT 28561]PKY01686.1 transcriptional coactivator/pterin dehydratase [Aspergillus campestris IBT 28561]
MDAIARTLRPNRFLLHSLNPTRRCYHRGLAPVASLATRPALHLRPSPTSPLRRPTQTPFLPTRLSSTSTQSQPAPKFADGVDVATAKEGVDALCEQGWVLDGDGAGFKKTFYFRSYFKAVSFVNVIASHSATKKHHATMTVRIGSVDVHWTTHHLRGLTEKDIGMARVCEDAAELMGVVEEGRGKKCGSA